MPRVKLSLTLVERAVISSRIFDRSRRGVSIVSNYSPLHSQKIAPVLCWGAIFVFMTWGERETRGQGEGETRGQGDKEKNNYY